MQEEQDKIRGWTLKGLLLLFWDILTIKNINCTWESKMQNKGSEQVGEGQHLDIIAWLKSTFSSVCLWNGVGAVVHAVCVCVWIWMIKNKRSCSCSRCKFLVHCTNEMSSYLMCFQQCPPLQRLLFQPSCAPYLVSTAIS